jgi:phage gpG-like protein
MKMGIKVSADQVTKKIQSMLDTTENFTPLFVEIIGQAADKRPWTLRGGVLSSFINKKPPQGKGIPQIKWAPLNKDYLKEKQVKWPGKPTLVASGELFNSLVNSNKSTVTIMSSKKLRWGTTVDYAKYLNYGTSKMPPRGFFGFADKQIKAIKSLTEQYLIESYNDPKNAAKEASSRVRWE